MRWFDEEAFEPLAVGGLVVSPALASAEALLKPAQSVSSPAQRCPCCSGNVTLPKDIKVQELKGAVAYFIALQKFNSKDALRLRQSLEYMGFKPELNKVTIQYVKTNNGTTEIVKVPLKGKYPAVLITVRNKLGTATGIAVYKNNSVIVYYYKDGRLQKYIRTIDYLSMGISSAVKCAVCIGVAQEICDIGYNRAVKWGCGRICGIVCAVLVEDPIAALLCAGTCYFVCTKILTNMRVKRITCSAGATAICVAIGMCKG